MGRVNTHLKAKRLTQEGFTLLEILLVIVMIAVTAAMVVPSISNISQGEIKEESNRLRLVLSYALEEAQLSGNPIRWRATKDGWSFETYIEDRKQNQQNNSQNNQNRLPDLNKKMMWQALGEPPLEEYLLPQGIIITQVEQAGEFFADALLEDDIGLDERGKEPTIGMLLLLPDGTTSLTNVSLQDEDENISVLEVRPGPAGIRLKKEGEG